MRLLLSLFLCLVSGLLFSVETTQAPQSFYEINVQTIDGRQISMAAFRGRVLLIVNVASKDKNATQIPQLEELYQKFSEQGFVVLAFPSSDFMSEEPGTNHNIRAEYQEAYHITFPLFDKVRVTGQNKSPLYVFLTSSKTDPKFGWEIDWNFTKFLIDRNGNVVNRFNTITAPNDPRMTEAIQKTLAS